MQKPLKRIILRIKQRLNFPYKNANNTFATEAKFPTKPYRLHILDKPPPSETTLTKEEALKYYRQMIAIRKMETKINGLYKSKQVRGFCHLYSGQEAIAVGLKSVLRPQDSIITSYRCHAWAYLFMKNPALSIISELLGKAEGSSKGKGGSMHMYGPNFWGGNAIVGAQVPVGVGIAFSYQYTGKDAVCLAVFGDGAINNGQMSEAFNMAMLWKIPCIFVCENNLYAMGTSVFRSSANLNLYTKGDMVPGIWADGMDFFTMKEVAKFALEHCLAKKGPILVEAFTYRYFGHSLSDPGTTYRTRDEISEMRKSKDPINSYKEKILAAGLVTEDELKKINDDAKHEVENATDLAHKAEDARTETLTYDVYSNDVIKEVRMPNPFKMAAHKTSGRSLNLK